VFRNVKKLPTVASSTLVPLPATSNDPLTNHSIVPDSEGQVNTPRRPSNITTGVVMEISMG
jgi:hypothetical protein